MFGCVTLDWLPARLHSGFRCSRVPVSTPAKRWVRVGYVTRADQCHSYWCRLIRPAEIFSAILVLSWNQTQKITARTHVCVGPGSHPHCSLYKNSTDSTFLKAANLCDSEKMDFTASITWSTKLVKRTICLDGAIVSNARTHTEAPRPAPSWTVTRSSRGWEWICFTRHGRWVEINEIFH